MSLCDGETLEEEEMEIEGVWVMGEVGCVVGG